MAKPAVADDVQHHVPGELLTELRGHLGGMHNRRSEEHTSELQSRETISYAVFCLKKKKKHNKLGMKLNYIHPPSLTNPLSPNTHPP